MVTYIDIYEFLRVERKRGRLLFTLRYDDIRQVIERDGEAGDDEALLRRVLRYLDEPFSMTIVAPEREKGEPEGYTMETALPAENPLALKGALSQLRYAPAYHLDYEIREAAPALA